VLVLTKPIGSGVLTSAAKAGKISEDDLKECIEVMVELNAAAGAAALEAGAHAATDITGFGLIGHAFEMAEGSKVTIELDAGAVPLMAGVVEMAKSKCLTRAHKSNLAYVGDRLIAGGIDELLVAILADAQTSGGLLIAVEPGRAKALVEAGALSHSWRVVGRVTSEGRSSLRLR
jgi:selenide,water dikinase